MKHILLLIALICGTIASADNAIVQGGVPSEDCLFNASVWLKSQNGIRGCGADSPVCSSKLFSPDELVITATLLVDELNGCAPRFTVGDVNCGFDGGNGDFFIEQLHGRPRSFPKSISLIEAGKPFTVAIYCKDGRLKYHVNSVFVGEFTYAMGKGLSVTFNPWRATATLIEFHVFGKENGDYIPPKKRERCADLVSIHGNATVTIPMRLPNAKYIAVLREGADTLAKCYADCDGASRVSFPAGVLKDAYSKSKSKFNVRPVDVSLYAYPYTENAPSHDFVFMLHDPLTKTTPATGNVTYRNGIGAFIINGEDVGTFSGTLASMGSHSADYDLGRFSNAGIDGSIVLISAFPFMDKDANLDADAFRRNIESKFAGILAYNPNAYFKVYFDLCMPQAWCKAHPEELIKLDNGKMTLRNAPMKGLQPSYASQLWRDQMGKVLAECIGIFQSCPFADRLPYLRLCYANCGEWNHWGYHEGAFVDFSKPMQRAFSVFLKEKYGSVGKLRKEWGTKEISFDDSLIPNRESRLKGGDYLRANGPEGMPSVDYYTFFQKMAAETITHFAHIAKEASSRKMVVGSYYGYYYGHYGLNPFHFQDSGNYGLSYILKSPDMDFVGGPYPYEGRCIHQRINGVASSIRLHGKLWESENDERTHYSGEQEKIYGTTKDLQETIAICKRNYMMNLEAGSCMYYYDFIRNWYRDNMDVIATMKKLDRAVRKFDMKSQARVAFLLSEKSIPFYSSQAVKDGAIMQAHHFFQYELPFLGMPTEFFLMSDLKNIDFSQFRVIVFPNCLYADKEIIADIRKYAAGGNRTLLFLHAPGAIDASNNIDEAQMKALTGIGMKVQPNEKFSVLENPYNKLQLPPSDFRTVIDDSDAKVLAKWEDGSVAMAEKSFPTWKSVVLCHQAPDAIFMRAFLNRNGAPIWASGRNGLTQCSFAGPLISMYSRNGGPQTFWLPQPVEVAADVITGEIYAQNSKTVNFKMPPGPNTTII
ncbi:MAG: family 14 glycosylhydrolase, partial [Victivallales bacterium]|nr:family 14 glycosylhydrolase [Victivallales bacterium]